MTKPCAAGVNRSKVARMTLPDANHPLVRALPDDLQAPALAALAAMPQHHADGGVDQTARRRWQALFELAGFQRYALEDIGQWFARPIPAASTLTARQRAVALLRAEVPGIVIDDYPLYGSAMLVRQWLGVDPMGPLFHPVDDGAGGTIAFFDRFRVLAASHQTKDIAEALVTSLPVARQLELIGELMLAGDCSDYEISEWLPALWPHLRDDVVSTHEVKAWVSAYADRLLALLDDPTGPLRTAHGTALRGTFGVTVLLVLVRAGLALEPRHDRLFTMWHLGTTSTLWEVVDAVPVERREAVVAAVATALGGMYIQRWAPELLQRYPLAGPTKVVLSLLRYVERPRDFMKALKAIGATAPPVEAVLKAHARKTPPIPKLVVDALTPLQTTADLDDVQQAQLVEANRRYGGTTMTATAIMQNTGEDEPEGDPQIVTAGLEHGHVVGTDGTVLYDVLLYNADAGTFFQTGTTVVVADVIQFGVEAVDKALGQGLQQALQDRNKKTAKKKAKKKKAATEKATTEKNPARDP